MPDGKKNNRNKPASYYSGLSNQDYCKVHWSAKNQRTDERKESCDTTPERVIGDNIMMMIMNDVKMILSLQKKHCQII